MRLPHDVEALAALGLPKAGLMTAIRERRKAIRSHRDQKGDDRCWLDDCLVWAMLADSPSEPPMLSFEEGMCLCREFYSFRRAEAADPVGQDALTDPRLWDRDLFPMDQAGLLAELRRIQQAIFMHRNIVHRHRTLEDDRDLYGVLPEKVPADFRLPPEPDFLGEAAAPHAGCPSFWRSHASCQGPCDLHAWGPCSRAAE